MVLNRLYVIDNVTKDSGYIFYADGKLIYVYSKDGFALKLEDVIGLSWKNAQSVGYWRADDHNRLKTEYFSCSNSGNYLIERGEITSDTISFERDCGSSPFKNKKCLTSYILSNMILNWIIGALFKGTDPQLPHETFHIVLQFKKHFEKEL